MSFAPFRDSTDTLLRRIDDLERANKRLRRRARESMFDDAASFVRGLCRVVAILICVMGMLIVGLIGLGAAVAIFAGIVGQF